MIQGMNDAPVVRLLSYTERPIDVAVASARTCYQPRIILPEEVTEGQKKRIANSIYLAGHHTPFQHPVLVYSIENVSRQFVWSFLHSHPWYNSEQTSQRYVPFDEVRARIPSTLSLESQVLFTEALEMAWKGYHRLWRMLLPSVEKTMAPLGRMKGLDEKSIAVEVEKKSIETARYLIPVAAHTQLYHTIPLIELHRYRRMMESGDAPEEAKEVVTMMVEEAERVEPALLEGMGDPPLVRAKLPSSNMQRLSSDTLSPLGDWTQFDDRMDKESQTHARLISHQPDGERLLAESVRQVIGANEVDLDDESAIRHILDPFQNRLLGDTLNSWSHDPLMRSLNHINYTFEIRLSHSADSQDQRHRTTPGSRPLLTRYPMTEDDSYTPIPLRDNPAAMDLFREVVDNLATVRRKLVDLGASFEEVALLLPNSTQVRFTQSGSLLNWLHKWRMRTCFNAQWEIYQVSMEQLGQVAKVHPLIAKWISPPCVHRLGAGIVDTGPQGPCPEGPRWCGVQVWKGFPKVKRPY